MIKDFTDLLEQVIKILNERTQKHFSSQIDFTRVFENECFENLDLLQKEQSEFISFMNESEHIEHLLSSQS
jgi:hypothetical protein